MKLIHSLLLTILLAFLSLSCTVSNGPSIQEANPKGILSIAQLAINRNAKSVISVNGGIVAASVNQYFIIKNVGSADITNINVAILEPINPPSTSLTDDSSTGPFFITDTKGMVSGFDLSKNTTSIAYIPTPITISTLSVDSSSSFTQLLSITIEHGTANNIGMTGTLPVQSAGIHSEYLAIYGISNSQNVTMVIKLDVLIQLADFEFYFKKSGDNSEYALSNWYTNSALIAWANTSPDGWDWKNTGFPAGFNNSSAPNLISPAIPSTSPTSLRFVNSGNVALKVYLNTLGSYPNDASIESFGIAVPIGGAYSIPLTIAPNGGTNSIQFAIKTYNSMYNFPKWQNTNFSPDSDVVVLNW